MKKLNINSNPAVKDVFKKHPKSIGNKLKHLRKLILETATEIENIDAIEETLKWGEPSYLVKKGSTIRLNRRKNEPDQYAIYFKCTSKLVKTFKEIYGDIFSYEKTRAIYFNLEDEVPEKELKHCISLALTYHQVKHLPFLGAKANNI
ncbi:MAG: DUF1801 domain-containing protein [Saprospiraceae bacterium]